MALKVKLRKPLTKPAPSGKSAKPTTTKKKRNVFDMGRTENEISQRKRESKMNKPFNFYLKVGETARVIILDDSDPEELFSSYIHQWQGKSGRWDQEEVCIKDEGICPLCQKLEREGQFVVFLTILDTRPYTNKKGETIKYGRKVLPIKPTMIAKFERLYRKHGTFRGMMIELSRDSEKGTNIGDSVEFVKFVKPELLDKIAARPNEQGKVCNYKKAYPRPTYEDMVKRYGGAGIPGSSSTDEEDEDLGDVDID